MDTAGRFIKDFLDEVGRPNQLSLTLQRFRGKYGAGGKEEEFYYECILPHKVKVYKYGLGLAKYADNYRNYKDKILLDHDLSKLSKEEIIFSKMDFSNLENNSDRDIEGFQLAWNHHKHDNPHHPEHWFYVNKSGDVQVLPMPNDYILEMVANWMAHGDDWIKNNVRGFVFHKKTARKVQALMGEFNFKLKAINFLNGKKIK